MMPQARATSSQGHSNGNAASDPEENGRDTLPGCDPTNTDYAVNCIHEGRPLSLNDIGRPIFVNHYYAGESVISVTSRKLIRLDECDELTEVSLRNHQMNMQPQGPSCESIEASLNSLRMPITTTTNVRPNAAREGLTERLSQQICRTLTIFARSSQCRKVSGARSRP